MSDPVTRDLNSLLGSVLKTTVAPMSDLVPPCLLAGVAFIPMVLANVPPESQACPFLLDILL